MQLSRERQTNKEVPESLHQSVTLLQEPKGSKNPGDSSKSYSRTAGRAQGRELSFVSFAYPYLQQTTFYLQHFLDSSPLAYPPASSSQPRDTAKPTTKVKTAHGSQIRAHCFSVEGDNAESSRKSFPVLRGAAALVLGVEEQVQAEEVFTALSGVVLLD